MDIELRMRGCTAESQGIGTKDLSRDLLLII